MAHFWTNLHYHEDDTSKHNITKEEVEFLNKLQHEINTQDHQSQADPRYWVIRDYDKVYGDDLTSPDGISIVLKDSWDTICEQDYDMFNYEKFLNRVMEDLEEAEVDEEVLIKIESCDDYTEVIAMVNEECDERYCVFEYTKYPKDSGCFLTQKAAADHLKANHYHYSNDAHTYAQTAWRSSEEKLWKILQTVNFNTVNHDEISVKTKEILEAALQTYKFNQCWGTNYLIDVINKLFELYGIK